MANETSNLSLPERQRIHREREIEHLRRDMQNPALAATALARAKKLGITDGELAGEQPTKRK